LRLSITSVILYCCLNERLRSDQAQKGTAAQAGTAQRGTRGPIEHRKTTRPHPGRNHLTTQERDRFHSELVIARQTIDNVDQIIAQNIREMRAKLEQENAESFNELQKLKDKLLEEKLLREKTEEEIKTKDTVISELSLRLKEMSRKYKDPSLLVNTKDISDQAAITNNNFYKLTEKYNKVCADMENIMA
jgi:hypothetical protein